MPVSHKGKIFSLCLSLSDTFHIPKLSINLLSVGQLCELGVDILFTNHGVDVQDPQTGQVLGIGVDTAFCTPNDPGPRSTMMVKF